MNRKIKIGLTIAISNFIAILVLMIVGNLLPIKESVQNLCSTLSFILTLPLMPMLLKYISPPTEGIMMAISIYSLSALINASIWGITAALVTKNKK
jgi:ABC-type Na+ efflux pump permease subunit